VKEFLEVFDIKEGEEEGEGVKEEKKEDSTQS
jgi:hypothetical protein